MIKNYFKTAFRYLTRNRNYSIVNIAGLAIGIASCVLIFLVIQFETSFDNFHKDKKNIYRIVTEFKTPDGLNYNPGISLPAGAGLRLDFPQIKTVASIFKNSGQIITYNGESQLKELKEDDFFYTEPEFFSMFNFGWLAGDPNTSLKDPNDAVLTLKTAEKFFNVGPDNYRDAIGKTFKYNNNTLYTVTGILKNVPPNSDFPLSVVVPYIALHNTSYKAGLNDWATTRVNAYTFVKLPPELNLQKFNNELKAFAKRHIPADDADQHLAAQPLAEMHSDARFGNFNNHTFSNDLINALALISIFLISIACANFINLATAQGSNRSKEIGIRKVLGSNRNQLAFQFLGETALITFAAVTIAVIIAKFVLPFLNNLLEVRIELNFVTNHYLAFFLALLSLFITLLAGLYPAIILSGFNPLHALQSKLNSKISGGINLRKALVILQFGIAQILIIVVLVVVSQMDYIKNFPLGFNSASIINVPTPADSTGVSRIGYLRNRLLQNPGIEKVSFSFSAPVSDYGWSSEFRFNHATKETDFSANLKWADVDYFKTYGLHFIAGRSFYPSDTVREFVINQTLLHKLGIPNPQDAIGKQINFWDGAKVGNVVGVIKDFNANSLRVPMTPMILSTWKDMYRMSNIKIKPGMEKATIGFIENLWEKTYPGNIFQYQFLDKTIANNYKQENQIAALYKIFAAIAIFISCLGLYGLISFMAFQRTKEVGIRKVLGASVSNIIYLFSKEFTVLLVIGYLIAVPVALYFTHQWLNNFAYKISLGAGIFLVAIIFSFFIAWITIGYRTIKAAMANPVDSLRSE